jgi:hypothetical protein
MVMTSPTHLSIAFDHSLTNPEILQNMVIVTQIWQKLSIIEHKVTFIVRNFWHLFHTYLAKPKVLETWPNEAWL